MADLAYTAGVPQDEEELAVGTVVRETKSGRRFIVAVDDNNEIGGCRQCAARHLYNPIPPPSGLCSKLRCFPTNSHWKELK